MLCARIMGWVCGLNLLLLALDSMNDFVFHPFAPLGALEIVADNADMRMDEGDNSTSLREQMTALRHQVATNTEVIGELRDELASLQGNGRGEHEKHEHDGGGGKHEHEGGDGKPDKDGADGKSGAKAGVAEAKAGHEDSKGAGRL